MDSSLPPFGIRHLRDGEPFSLLQIDEKQYQSIIDPYPNAVLSYIDEDDGEDVTVGSGLELRQRLAESPTIAAPVINCYNVAKKEEENQTVHLFDIKKTLTNRSIWKEQALAYRAARRLHQRAQKAGNASCDSASISSIDLNSTRRGQSAAHSDTESDVSPESSHPMSPQQFQPGSVSSAIPSLIENLADLLQTTSDALRKAAEKSRDTRTSPIEDVLTGVSNIVTEVGQFGLSLLDNLNDDASNSSEQSAVVTLASNTAKSVESVENSVRSNAEEKTRSSSVPLAADNSTQPIETTSQAPMDSHHQNSNDKNKVRCKFCVFANLPCQPSVKEGRICANCITLGQSCKVDLNQGYISPPVVQPPFFSAGFPHHKVKDDSILDQDTDDADFSRRYPPLMSLRRANTVTGLHDRFGGYPNLDLDEKGLNRHHSWINRYPHRPVPQVLDAETRRRKDFARDCFPTQKYTPGPGTKDSKMPSGLQYSTSKAATDAATSQLPVSLSAHSNSQVYIEVDPILGDSHSPPKDKTNIEVTESPKASNATVDSPVEKHKSLPGAWPDLPEGQKTTKGSLDEESSGAFFHRMMRDNPARRQNHAPETNDRLTRHRSFTRQRPSRNPFSDLNRSNTVSDTVNPASRLNRPFDPLSPTIVPADTGTLDLEVKTMQNGLDTSFLGTSEPRTKLHQRPATLHRPFSPVWEEHLNQMKIHKEKISKLDRNGESSSMYSPPPRHMRSVPNFNMSASLTPPAHLTIKASEAPAKIASVAGQVLQPAVKTPFVSDPPGSYNNNNHQKKPPQVVLQRQPPTKPSFDERFPPLQRSSTNPFRQPALPPVAPIHRPRLPSKPASEAVPRRSLRECINALRDMGYGEFDKNLQARLHVYAEAAGGDITEAVDMIEQDKRASY